MGIDTIIEIPVQSLNAKKFIAEQVRSIRDTVGGGVAINALSGGVDSSVVTALGYEALERQLLTYFIDNGLMRQDEPKEVVNAFKEMGIEVFLFDAKQAFFDRLSGLTEPEEKREAITQAFYKDVFGHLVAMSGAHFLLQGTNYADVKETVGGIKRQHNVLSQLGIDTEAVFGYTVIEPLIQLTKPGVRKLAKALNLPREITERAPFPGPALAARVIGEATPERIEIARRAHYIVDQVFREYGIRDFQHFPVLFSDPVTGMRDGKREYAGHIDIRSWQSKDAITATPTRLPWDMQLYLAERITNEMPEIVSVSYNVTAKPPSTIEAV